MNMEFPFYPRPIPYPPYTIEEEIIRLKQEINILKERLTKFEQEKPKNYLQKDDSLYMMWTNLRSFFVDYYSFMLY